MSFFVLSRAKSPCAPSRLTLAVLAVCAAPAWAQTAAQPSGQTVTELPGVLVQARRAAEMAKDVPFTVNVIGGDELEQRRLGNLEDILRSTPGVDVNSWGGVSSANVRIRGVGSLYQSGMDGASVITNIDGVSTSVSNTGLGTLDIEQVEGVQGAAGHPFGAQQRGRCHQYPHSQAYAPFRSQLAGGGGQ